jgi:prevent-host-death family protein
LWIVTTIPHKELRTNIAAVLRRAEAGEEFTVTVAGRPVARLGPARHREWISGARLQRVWQTPPPQTLEDDLGRLGGGLVDPFSAK